MGEDEENDKPGDLLGHLTREARAKDYVLLFVLTFVLARYLTPTAIFLMFASTFAFHMLHGVTYHDEVPKGFNAHHLNYFLGTYLLSVLYLQLRRMYLSQGRVSSAVLRSSGVYSEQTPPKPSETASIANETTTGPSETDRGGTYMPESQSETGYFETALSADETD